MVIGFDTNGNLVRGEFAVNPVQDLTSITSFVVSSADWTTLKANHYLVLDNIELTGLNIAKEFVNIKGTINSITQYVKLNRNVVNIYSGLFYIAETVSNVDHLYELAVYYSNLTHTLTLRCATIY